MGLLSSAAVAAPASPAKPKVLLPANVVMMNAGAGAWHKAGAKIEATPIAKTKTIRLKVRCFTYDLQFLPRRYLFTSPQSSPLFRHHDGIGRVPRVVFHGNRIDRREIVRQMLRQHGDILRCG